MVSRNNEYMGGISFGCVNVFTIIRCYIKMRLVVIICR